MTLALALLTVSAPPPLGLVAQPFCGSQDAGTGLSAAFSKRPRRPPHLSLEKCSREKSLNALSIHWSLCSSRPRLCCPGFRLMICLFSVGRRRREQSKLLLAPLHVHLNWLLTQKRAHMEGVPLPRALLLRRTEVLEQGPLLTPRGSSSHSCVLAQAPHRPAVCRAGRKGVCMASATLPPSFLPCSVLVNSGMCSRIHYGTGEHLMSNAIILLAPLFFSWRRCFVFSS